MLKKFPHYPQLEFSDCGPTCLKIILKYYGKDCSIEYLRELCVVTRVGVSMKDIAEGAKKTGFAITPYKATIDEFDKNVILPCVLHWQQEHFLVLYKIKNGFYYLSDPAFGRIKLNRINFEKLWKGEAEEGFALLLTPTDHFFETSFPFKNRKESIKRSLPFFKDLTKGHYAAFFFLVVLIAIATIIGYVFPTTMQILFDEGIKSKQFSVLWMVLFFQLSLLVGQSVASWIQALIRINLSMKMSIKLMSDLLLKVIRLPIRFFDNRAPADLLQRIDDQRHIENFLSEQIIQNLFSFILIVVLTIELFQKQILIGAGFLLLSILSVIWGSLFLKKTTNLDYADFRISIANRNSLNEIVAGMIELKINDAQEKKVSEWTAIQQKLSNLRVQSLKLRFTQQFGSQLFTQLKRVGATIVCAFFVIQNKMTVGELLSIGYIVGVVEAPFESLMRFNNQSLQEARLAFKRLDNILEQADENGPAKKKMDFTLTEGISLQNISYRYEGAHQKYVLNNVDAFIPKGKITAIVGTSGSGKTTLLKLLLSFYQPQIGKILLDDTDLSILNSDQWRKKCGTVMQDGYIFSGSIADNITIFESSPNLQHLQEACEIACILDFVNTLPMRFNTKIGNIGTQLSGGQKQRLLIARAVYKNPEFLFLDEATSALDANNEHKIINNLDTFFQGKTVVIIAHRLSTVKNADQILVLEKGAIIEKGTHDMLIKNKSGYFELIKNQLELGG